MLSTLTQISCYYAVMKPYLYRGEKSVIKRLKKISDEAKTGDIFYVSGDLFIFQSLNVRAAWIELHEELGLRGVDCRGIYPPDCEGTIRRALQSAHSLALRFQLLEQPLAWFLTGGRIFAIGMDPEPFLTETEDEREWRYYRHFFLSQWLKGRPERAVEEVGLFFGFQPFPRLLAPPREDARLWHDLEKNRYEPGQDEQLKFWSVPLTTARFLACFSVSIGAKRTLEIGSGGGYSTLHLSQAAEVNGGTVTTIERHPHKARMVRDLVKMANLATVDSLEGDARMLLPSMDLVGLDFVFLDADRKNYPAYLGILLPRLKAGGFIVVDNAFDYGKDMAEYRKLVDANPNLRSYFLHLDNGLYVTKKIAD
jgi:predicted O-methyltransferase YrrM